MRRGPGLGLGVCLALLLAPVARAELPLGEYVIELGGDNGLARPYDFVDLCLEGLCLEGDLDTSTSGAISGDAAMSGDIEGVSLDLDVAITGQASGSTVKPKVGMSLDIDGVAEYGGYEFTVSGSGKAKCGLDLVVPGQLQCKGRLKLCLYDGADKLACESGPFEGPLAFERVPFDVVLDLATDERNVVTGDAVVEIDAAPVFAYSVTGKYKESADTATLKLASGDPAVKTKVALKKVVLEAGAATAGTVTFKVAGQKGKATLPAVPP
jgi:hypothetical protein